MLQTTALYASVLAIMFFVMSLMVIGRRRDAGVGLCDGGDEPLVRAIRGHANFAEYVPIVLILMAILEFNGIADYRLHGVGLLLLVGRMAHGWCFLFTGSQPLARTGGMILTLTSLITAAIGCLWLALSG